MSTFSLTKKIFYNDDSDEEETAESQEANNKKRFYLNESMTEIGQVAILSSSKASLKYISSSADKGLNASSRNSFKRRESANLLKKSGHVKDETIIEEATGTCASLAPFKGTIYGVLSAFSFCAAQVVMKRTKHFSPSDISLIRYIVSLILMVIILRYHKLKLLGPRKQFKLLLTRGIFGAFSLLSFYFSLMLMNPSDSVALLHSSIIITAVLSRLFLGEKLTLAHFFAIVLTANGVLFISKPSFIFENELDLTNGNDTDMGATENDIETIEYERLMTLLGSIIYSFHLRAFFFYPILKVKFFLFRSTNI